MDDVGYYLGQKVIVYCEAPGSSQKGWCIGHLLETGKVCKFWEEQIKSEPWGDRIWG